MTNALVMASYPVGRGTTANTTQYFPISGDTFMHATEANRQVIMEFAGTFSELYILIITSNTNAVSNYTFRKNAANVNQIVSPGGAATGAFEDSTHTDVVALADKVAVQDVPSTTGSMTITIISLLFDTGTTNTPTRMIFGMNESAFTSASTTFFYLVEGLAANLTMTTEQKCRQREAGTFTNLMAHCSANARTATTFNGRLNGANGVVTQTLGASTTGFIEDTTHSDTVAVGDDYNLSWVTGTGTSSMTLNQMAIDFVSTARFTEMSCGNQTPNTTPFLANVTNYAALGGCIESTSNSATEANLQAKTRAAYTLQQLTVMVPASGNSVTATTTIRTRKNTANGNQSVSIGSSATGVFNDNVNTDVCVSADLVNYQLVMGATGTSIQVVHMSTWGSTGIFQIVYVEWEE